VKSGVVVDGLGVYTEKIGEDIFRKELEICRRRRRVRPQSDVRLRLRIKAERTMSMTRRGCRSGRVRFKVYASTAPISCIVLPLISLLCRKRSHKLNILHNGKGKDKNRPPRCKIQLWQ
jgi:hypothetical protein